MNNNDGLNSDRVVAKVFFPDDTVEEVMSRRDNQQIERALILVAIRDVLVDMEGLDRAALDGFPDMLDHEIEGDVPVVLVCEDLFQSGDQIVFHVNSPCVQVGR